MRVPGLHSLRWGEGEIGHARGQRIRDLPILPERLDPTLAYRFAFAPERLSA